VSANELAERHTSLGDLWGCGAGELRERLALTPSLDDQLDLIEATLLARIPKIRAMHPAVAEALARFEEPLDVGEVVKRSGYSHRRFIDLFRDAVGLAPKVFSRVTRFQRALACIAAQPRAGWAQIALAAGYADQPHMNREFHAFTGMSPGRYRAAAPESPNHLPIVR
jgi:transcriptional regulator GlxA family with amidase domain